MATQPVLTLHDGRLEIPERLQAELNLHEGSELHVVSCLPGQLTLAISKSSMPTAERTTMILDSLQGMLPNRRTPEWEAEASTRKALAKKRLDLLGASGAVSATELKQAEREWELADDEFDFGPLPRS